MPRWEIMRPCVAVSCLFLGRSLAVKPYRSPHQVRQATEAGATTSVATTTTSSGASLACTSEFEEIVNLMPTEPPEYSSFSSSYYESHPRTADDPLFDCDWIEELPEDLDEVTLEDQNRTAEWFAGLDSEEDGELFTKAIAYITCAEENTDSLPCQAELSTYVSQVEERVGSVEESGESAEGSDGSAEESDESSGVHVKDDLRLGGIPISLLVAIGVSFLGVS